MLIAIDISQINLDNAGINQYAKEIISRLLKNKEHEFLLLTRSELDLSFAESNNWQQVVIKPKVKIFGGFYAAVGSFLKKHNVEVLLAFPLSPAALFFKKTVIFIYDLAPLTTDQYKSRVEKFKYWLLVKLNVAKASQIITISKATLSELNKLFPTQKDVLVPVAYPGLSDRFTAELDLKKIKSFKEEYGLGEKFVLSVGTVQPRKNYLAAVQAFFSFNLKNNLEWQYVIAGKLGWDYEPLLEYIQMHHLENHVKILSNLNDDEVVLAMNAANVFLQLSLQEGFGMPLVEAASAGLPIVASDIEVFKEIDAPNTTYVDPLDVYAAARALDEVQAKKHQNVSKTFLKKFNWEKSSEIVMETLVKVGREESAKPVNSSPNQPKG